MSNAPDAEKAPLDVGFIGLGDQGLPMAEAISGAGYPLHVWARNSASIDRLGGAPHTSHDTAAEMSRRCDVVGICIDTDEHTMERVTDELCSEPCPLAHQHHGDS